MGVRFRRYSSRELPAQAVSEHLGNHTLSTTCRAIYGDCKGLLLRDESLPQR